MDWYIILLGVIDIIIILLIYYKYNKDAEPSEKLEYYKEPLEISASEASFLYDKNQESVNLILADILTLAIKKQIKMELVSLENGKKEYIFYKNPNVDFSQMKAHESMSYELFFDINEENDAIYLSDFLNKLENTPRLYKELEIKCYAIKESISTELEKQEITDSVARKKMQKINRNCISFCILSVLAFIIAVVWQNTTALTITYITMAFSFILYCTTDRKEEKITQKGANILEKTKALKNYIRDYVLIDDKPIYIVNILDYYYVMAAALGMAEFGQKEFYGNSLEKAKIKTFFVSIKEYIKHNKTILIILIILIGIGYYVYNAVGGRNLLLILIGIIYIIGESFEKKRKR